MSRLIFVPQFPAKLRYQNWWITEFPYQFKNHFDEVITLGSIIRYDFEKKQERDNAMFSSIDQSILFECEQVKEYLSLSKKEDDVLFLADLSFAGLFTNVLFHYPVQRMYAFCHATSMNTLDYFEKCRKSKYLVEAGHADLFKKVFVGSKYHEKKLHHVGYFTNTEVVYLPPPAFSFFDSFKNVRKTINIVSASRPTPQKVNSVLENEVETKFGKIIRKNDYQAFIQYYAFLSTAKILLSTANEETFGYQIVDAIMCNCIPIAPNKFSYPELLPKEYLYNDEIELFEIIENALNGNLEVPTLLCQNEVDNFYNNICRIMKGE
jgi:hypothetical protein